MDSDNKISLNENFFAYVKENMGKDAMRLRLKKNCDADFPIDLAITQVEARNRRLEQKLPSWTACDKVVFPSILATEQCSSEDAARNKQPLVVGDTLCDLTGGLGIDTYYMAQRVKQAVYIEQNELYSLCAKHNFAQLGFQHITVLNSDCATFLQESAQYFDTIYIDPARRSKSQERVYALADCEPNVLLMLDTLSTRCKRLIIKLSPMVDITLLQQELQRPCCIHIVSVNNECKEILAVIDFNSDATPDSHTVVCDLLRKGQSPTEHRFDLQQEASLPHSIAHEVQAYLYEPDAAIMKAGVFKLISERFAAPKLNKSSHLYTSDTIINDFPGRGFRVVETLPFSSSLCKKFASQYPACNIATRNFPLSANDLRKKLRVKDGGDIYLFATTNHDNKHILAICNKI